MKISTVPGSTPRSMRVRNLSRLYVPPKTSATLPSVRCRKSCGAAARFSAQSVSMTPLVGWSTAMAKPFSCQNERTMFHDCSGVALTTSQRSLPARTILASGTVGSKSPRPLLLAFCAARPDAELTW